MLPAFHYQNGLFVVPGNITTVSLTLCGDRGPNAVDLSLLQSAYLGAGDRLETFLDGTQDEAVSERVAGEVEADGVWSRGRVHGELDDGAGDHAAFADTECLPVGPGRNVFVGASSANEKDHFNLSIITRRYV